MHRSRRNFLNQLVAGAVLTPFLPLVASRRARAQAAATTPKRLVVVTSMGTSKTFWKPVQPAGGALQLPEMLSPLAAIAKELVLVDGLSFPNPTEGHGTPQVLTGYGYNNAYMTSCNSIDQYVASKVGMAQRLPSLLLGWQAKNEAHFFAGGRALTTLDSPSDAWQSAFAGLQVAGASKAAASDTDPRQQIWQAIEKQVQTFANQLTGDNKARVTDHARSMAALLARANGGGVAGSCVVPAQPTLGGLDPNVDSSQTVVGAAHVDLITAALACDLTRVVGMQFGVSNRQYIAGQVNDDQHTAIHSYVGNAPYQAKLIGADQAMCSWFVTLTQALQNTQDPLVPGTSLLDNTLVLWARDFGEAPAHTHFSVPYALVGGGSYLKKEATGRYVNLGGDDASRTPGAPHQRLLLNLIDYMGAGSGSDFGTLASADRSPLSQLRA